MSTRLFYYKRSQEPTVRPGRRVVNTFSRLINKATVDGCPPYFGAGVAIGLPFSTM